MKEKKVLFFYFFMFFNKKINEGAKERNIIKVMSYLLLE